MLNSSITLKIIRCYIVFICCLVQAHAQMSIVESSPQLSVNRIVRNYFAGDGMKIIQVKYTGQREAIGKFSDQQAVTGCKEGMVLSTGMVNLIGGKNTRPNTSVNFGDHFFSDPQLKSTLTTCDGVVLTIDFIPDKDSIVFSCVFGTDDYPESIDKDAGDQFGFFIKRLDVKEHFKPIGRWKKPLDNTIDSGLFFHQYLPFIDNTKPENLSYHQLEFDGYTPKFYSGCRVIKGKTYRLKIVLMDVDDCEYDSGLLFESYSFRSISSKPVAYAPKTFIPKLFMQPNCDSLSLPMQKKLMHMIDTLKKYGYDSIIIKGLVYSNNDTGDLIILGLKRAEYIMRFFTKQHVPCLHYSITSEERKKPNTNNNQLPKTMGLKGVEITLYRKSN